MGDEEIKESQEEIEAKTEEQEQEEAKTAFSEAFREGSGDDKKPDEEKKDPEEKAEEKEVKADPDKKEDETKPEDKDAKGKEKEDLDDKETKKEGDDEEDEEDETDKRGEELIKAEKDAEEEKEEQKKKAEEEKQLAAQKIQDETVQTMTDKDADYFLKLVPNGRFPQTIKVDDIDLDLGKYVGDNPEVALLAVTYTQELLSDLVTRGVLNTAQQTNDKIDAEITEKTEGFESQIFSLSVRTELQDMGHMGIQLDSIVESDKFQKWGPKQSEKVKALFRSDSPRDYAFGVQRYLMDAGIVEAKKKAKEHDEKAEQAKEKHIDLYGNTMDSRGGTKDDGLSESEGKQEFSDGFRAGSKD